MAQMSLMFVVTAALAGLAGMASAMEPVPKELAVAVSKVHAAALRSDYKTLRDSMVKEFTWSFGGDGDVEQALAEWKNDSKYLRSLAKVTGAKCGWIERGVYQCPAKASLEYRAGFRQDGDRWKMVYFVAGD